MQSSSSGMLSVLGLLACAAAAGVFAAHKWPQGPPSELSHQAWRLLYFQLRPAPPAAAQQHPDYGPPPKFGESADGGHLVAPGGFAPPEVIFDDSPPPTSELPDEGRRQPKPPSMLVPQDAGMPLVQPASVPLSAGKQREPKGPQHGEAKTSAFWPNDLADFLPGMEATDPKVVPSTPAAASSRAAKSHEPSVEELMRRLEQMGAVVMRLERQRGTPASYLFRCELPLNPRYHRFFQAVDAEPARAVERVARDIEAWKATIPR